MSYSGNIIFPKRLNDAEEEACLDKFFNGNEKEKEEARNALIERNLRLVAYVAKKYASATCSAEDLISVGTIGLIKAVSTFKEDKGNKIGTYALRCIQNEILMYMRSGKKQLNEVSMNEPVGMDKEGNEIVIMDLLCADDEEMIDSIDRKIQSSCLMDVMNRSLTDKEKEVIMLRYGLSPKGKLHEEMTQKEVGKLLNCSRSYISRLEKRAVEKLHKEMCDNSY